VSGGGCVGVAGNFGRQATAAQARGAGAAADAGVHETGRRTGHRVTGRRQRARGRVAAVQTGRRARREGPSADRDAAAQARTAGADGRRHAVLGDGRDDRRRTEEEEKEDDEEEEDEEEEEEEEQQEGRRQADIWLEKGGKITIFITDYTNLPLYVCIRQRLILVVFLNEPYNIVMG